MYMEGSTKGILAIVGALLIVLAASFWDQTLFLIRFLWDLLVLNLVPALHHIGETLRHLWPF